MGQCGVYQGFSYSCKVLGIQEQCACTISLQVLDLFSVWHWEWEAVRATSAVQAFKDAVYGPQHDQEEADAAAERAKGSIASQKRKAAAEVACKESQNYDWGELADTGKVDILMSAQCATLFNDEQSNEVTYS